MCGNCEYERYSFFNSMTPTKHALSAIEIKKDLYKNKSNAVFQYYEKGYLWYRITTSFGVFDIPIAVFEVVTNETEPANNRITIQVEGLQLNPEIGATPFANEIKASELNRWIERSINNTTFRVISITLQNESN